MKRANFGKIKTQDISLRSFRLHDFRKITLKIEGGGVSREILPQLLMRLCMGVLGSRRMG